MKLLSRAGAAVVALAVLSAGLVWSETGRASADDDWVRDPAPRGTTYLAMGDSYSSGEGLGKYGNTDDGDENQCHRSETAYSAKVQKSDKLRLLHRRFVACSGSQTSDLYTPMYPGETHAQMDQLGSNTAAVTLTVGGNDLGFVPILTDCVYTDHLIAQAFVTGRKNCEKRKTKSVTNTLARFGINGNNVASGNRRLADVLADIHARAPKAEIYVVGYPRLFGSELTTKSACRVGTAKFPGPDAALWVSKSDTEWLNSVVDLLNSAIATTVKTYQKTLPIHYVPVRSSKDSKSYYQHGICDKKAAWINKLIFPKDSREPETGSFHPNQDGADAYSRAISIVEKPTLPPQIMPSETLKLTVGTTLIEAGLGLRGNPAGTWRITLGALPPGLSMGGNGRITGSPTEVGDYRMTLRFTAATGAFDDAGYRILVTGGEDQSPVRWKSTTGLVPANILECPQADSCFAFSWTQVSRSVDGIWKEAVDLPQLASGAQHAASCPTVDFCAIATSDGTYTSTDMVNWTRGTTYPSQVVSCSSKDFCMTVGSWHSGPRAWIYRDGEWTAATDQPWLVIDLDCVSSSFCAAVNYNGDRLTWDGQSWAVSADPMRSQYVTVGCANRTDCTAGTQGGMTSTWNGTRWTDSVVLSVDQYIQTIDCADLLCHLAAGSGLFSRDDTANWDLETVAELPNDTRTDSIKDLACTSAKECYALFTGGSIDAWDGSKWTKLPRDLWSDATPTDPGPFEDRAPR